MIVTLTSIPMISPLWKPKDIDVVVPFLVTYIDTMQIRKQKQSEKEWAASDIIAIEFA